jgi:hypothetical protein
MIFGASCINAHESFGVEPNEAIQPMGYGQNCQGAPHSDREEPHHAYENTPNK